MWADMPCGQGERKKVMRACSVFFLRPAFGATTSQACSWRVWVLGDEHGGLTSTLCLHNVSHGGYAPALS
jgi:hypothetical protein